MLQLSLSPQAGADALQKLVLVKRVKKSLTTVHKGCVSADPVQAM